MLARASEGAYTVAISVVAHAKKRPTERITALGLSEIRDIAVIVLAFVSALMAFSVLFLVLAVVRLASTIQEEIRPLLRSLVETSNTVKGTTQFVSEAVVRPTARAAGKTIGILRFARTMADAVRRIQKSQD